MLSDYTVVQLAAESPHGWERGLAWIEVEEELVQSSGWCTLAGVVALRPDASATIDKVADRGRAGRKRKKLRSRATRPPMPFPRQRSGQRRRRG